MSRRTLKVIIVGDGSAGKTSLRSRYLNDTYHPAYRSTIGADFISKTIEVNVPVPTYRSRKAKQDDKAGEASTSAAAQQPVHFRSEKIKITLTIWDTAGQERFKALGTAFYRGSDAVIIAFDLSAKGALARTLNWYNDFCRLGDVGREDEGMNSRQLKIAREQRERFCWVGVGCKGDLLQGLRQSQKGKTDEEEQWKGVSWAEARGWFDTMIPRHLPDGEEEKQEYPNYDTHEESNEETALPYNLGQEVPARPEDVLSRPNKGSISSQNGNFRREVGASLGRPSEAGPPPGTAPTPGKALQKQKQHQSPRKSHPRNESKGRGLREKRKSIRSIDVWQGDQNDVLDSSVDSTSSTSNAAPVRQASESLKEGSHRSRYDSAASTGGSVYYSVRGSTIQSGSPAGSTSSPSSSSGMTAIMRSGSLRSQDTRIRKQSNLSESVIDDGDEESHDTETEREVTSHKSSETVKEARNRTEEIPIEQEDEGSDGSSFIPTIPSGDPIPFPLGDDFEDDEEVDMMLHRGNSLRSKSRSISRSVSRKDPQTEEGQVGRQTKAIAEETHRLREEGDETQGEENKRATLYSARPSSISSTIKPGNDEDSDKEDGDMASAGEMYRDQMMEQGFRLFFTSAKDGEGIDAVFEHVAKRVAMRWKLEEWEELAEAERLGGGRGKNGQIRTAPPTDEEVERERVKRAIKISSGKGTGNCCS